MKKTILLTLISLCLFLTGCAQHTTNFYKCKTNDDCVLIARGCCIFIAINKKHRDEIEISAAEALDASCYKVCGAVEAICENNICKAEK